MNQLNIKSNQKRKSVDELIDAAKLFHILSEGKFVSLPELQEEFKKSASTIQRRLEIIKDDFKNYTLINHKNRGYKLTPVNNTLSRNNLKQESGKSKVLFKKSHQDSIADNIAKIDLAITRKNWIRILNYKPVSSNLGRDYTILPLQMYVSNDPFILGIDKENKKLKRFNLKRGESIIVKTTSANKLDYAEYQQELENVQYDDFGWNSDKNIPVQKIILKLNNYSMNMLENDFPSIAKKRVIDKKDNTFEYKVEINFCNINTIGRFVTGLLNHIKIEGSEEVKHQFRDFVKMTVLDSMNNIENNHNHLL